MSAVEDFRAELRTWLEANATKRERVGGSISIMAELRDDPEFIADAKRWQRNLADGGWGAITWPKAYGGREAGPLEVMAFAEELAAYDVPQSVFLIGLGMIGPTIIAHGTDAQKERFLPPLYRGDEIWCQLFSEPGAGSDLAGLACRAERDGDEWIINGQKVWTSGAQHSDWGILLARTDWDAPKHRGITYFLFPMHQDGVEIRPLRQMTGAAHFNEVFLTDARVAHENILGDLNGGWGVAMTTLANERTAIGGGRGTSLFDQLVATARQHGRLGDPTIRQQLAGVYTRTELIGYLGQRGGAASMVLKLFFAQHLKASVELALAIEGPAGALSGTWQDQFLSAPSIRIAGGSDEVQRNILGERVLGLPAEPRPDKTAPFRDLPR